MNTKATKPKSPGRAAPRSVTRVLNLFGTLAHFEGGASLGELSDVLNSPKSSLSLLLRPLVVEGFLISESGRYRLGPAIYRLAATISSTRNPKGMIRPYIQHLAAQLSESVYLAVIDSEQALCSYIEGVDCMQAVRFVLPLGQSRPLYSTAAGRVLLAYQDKAWIERYLMKTKLVPVTEKTIATRDRLRQELVKIRQQGYATTVDEGFTGATGVAAPIFSGDGQIWAAMLVALPTPRFQEKSEATIAALLSITSRASGEIQAVA